MQAEILIIDDAPDIRDTLCDYLGAAGFALQTAGTARAAIQLLEQIDPCPDVCLLDLELPDNQGFELLQTLNKHYPGMPVIIVSGRTNEADRVLGLELGANDFITKPFSLRELQARVRVALRTNSERTRLEFKHAGSAKPVSIAGIRFDPVKRTLSDDMTGETQKLTEVEALSLGLLIMAEGQPVKRQDFLLDRDRHGDCCQDRSVDITMTRLRKKISCLTDQKPIETVRGEGYRLRKDLLGQVL